MKIVFPNRGALPDLDPEHVRVTSPVPGATREQVVAEAKRVVPSGVPYLIVDDESIPSERDDRAAWRADFSNPDGMGEGA